MYLRLLKFYDAEKAILLEDIDWRPHFVAGTALLMIHSANSINELWKTFDRGRWVNAQLAEMVLFYLVEV